MTRYTPPQLDVATVRSFLEQRVGAPISAIERLNTGHWTTTYSFDTSTDSLIARFGTYGDDFRRDELAMQFAGPDVPVPDILEIGSFGDSAYAISRRMPGGFLDELSADEMTATLPTLFGTWDALAQIDLVGTSGFGGVDVTGNAPFPTMRDFLLAVGEETDDPRNGGWRLAMESMPGRSRQFDLCFGALTRLLDAVPNERYVAHSDFLNFNVLVRDRRISALLDWGCLQFADRLYDLALFVLYQPWYPEWSEIDFAGEYRQWLSEKGVGIERFDERLRAAIFHIGLGNLRYNALQQREKTFVETAARLERFLDGLV